MSEAPARAIPKSVTFAWSSSSTITLCGFRSRWITPRRWAKRAALRICIVMSIARTGSSGASSRISCLSVRPGEVLHRDVVGVVELAAVVDADDVGVLQPGRGLGLAAEALDEPGVLRRTGGAAASARPCARAAGPRRGTRRPCRRVPRRETHLVATVDDRAGFDLRTHCPSANSVLITSAAIGAAYRAAVAVGDAGEQ